jgi:hypothetical protein
MFRSPRRQWKAMVISILMSHSIGLWLTRDEARRIAVNSSRQSD